MAINSIYNVAHKLAEQVLTCSISVISLPPLFSHSGAHLQAAARIVLQDWNDGRIPYYTLPPTRDSEVAGSAAVVSEFAADFSVEELNEDSLLAQLPGGAGKGFAIDSFGQLEVDLEGAAAESSEEELMEGEANGV